MRILHTSDWHLGLTLHGLDLLPEQRFMVERLLEVVERERVQAVVIAGDLFDHSVSGAEAIALYDQAITRLCGELRVPVVAIAGNHDGAARLSSLNRLLERSGLYLAGAIEREPRRVVLKDCAFHLLPYFQPEKVRYLFPEQPVRGQAEAMDRMLAAVRPRLIPGLTNILVAHAFVVGGQVGESDRAAQVGGAAAVPLELFEPFDYVALGHLHRAQELGPRVRYSGAPLAYSFGEAGQQKTVTLLDTETMERRALALPVRHPLRVVSGPYEQLLEEARAHPSEDYLKVEISDRPAGLTALEEFRQHYPNLLMVRGMALEAEGRAVSLTTEEAARLSPEDILVRYFEEMSDQPLDEEMLGWFRESLMRVEQEGERQ